MFEISRITVLYSAEEDRIAFDVADAAEQVRRLWLTRRLLDSLVHALGHQLEQRGMPQGEQDAQAQAPARQAAQVYAQLQARIAKRPELPVSLNSDSPRHLIHEIGIARQQQGPWRLTFHVTEDDSATLTIPAGQLRQWLESLHRNYRKAGWPTGVFPVWVGGSTVLKT